MSRRWLLLATLLPIGCFPVKQDLKPMALTGKEIRIPQSKYRGLVAIPEYYTNAEELKIEIVVAGAKPSLDQTVLWMQSDAGEPWRRGPASASDERWIVFRPEERRYSCRASVIYKDGSEGFKPRPSDPACFHLVVDRTPPHITLVQPASVLANATASIRFELWDSSLGLEPKATLYLSSDGGKGWERLGIIDVELGENSYGWPVPDRVGASNILRITCRDLADNIATVQCAKPFTILPLPTASEALSRFVTGVPSEDKAPAKESPKAKTESPPREERKEPPSAEESVPPPAARAAVPAKQGGATAPVLRLQAPPFVKAGGTATVQVLDLPAGIYRDRPRIRWRSAPGANWEETNTTLTGDHLVWTFPTRDTFQGRLRLELIDRKGQIAATGETGDIVVDGTPPTVTVDTGPAADDRSYRINLTAHDPGTGIAWTRLFITRDGGRTWQEHSRATSPGLETVIQAGPAPIGLWPQAQDKAGNGSPAPAAGTAARAMVPARSDLSLTLNELGSQILRGGERISLAWEMTGTTPPGSETALAMRTGEGLPWKQVEKVDATQERLLWELPSITHRSVWFRLELHLPGGATVTSPPVGPYAIDADPPRLSVKGSMFWASSLLRLPIIEENAGPASITDVTLFLRKRGQKTWQALPSNYERQWITAHCVNIPEGLYDVAIVARDTTGNTSASPEATTRGLSTLIVDKTPPKITATLTGPWQEGVGGKATLTLEEACSFTVLLRSDGERAETALLTRSLGAGDHTIRLRPPPRFRKGVIWVRGKDRAGNRVETATQPLSARPSVRFVSPLGGEAFTVGEELTVEFWVHPDLIKEQPTAKLWWESAPGETRQPLADQLKPQPGTFSWVVPDRAGADQSLTLEVRTNGVLRATGKTAGTFEIRKRKQLPKAGQPTVVGVDPYSADRADEGQAFLDDLAETFKTGRNERAGELRTQAETRFREAILRDRRNAKAWHGLAQLYAKPYAERPNRELVEEYLTNAVNADPGFYQALVHLGACRIQLKKYKEAESALGHALNLRDDDTAVRYNLGLALFCQKKYAPALDEFRRALAGKRPVTKAYIYIIDCLAQQKNYTKAREVLKEAKTREALSEKDIERIGTWLEGKLASRDVR